MKIDNSNAGISVAMLGARMGYAVPVLLHAAGRLKRFYTDYYSGRGIGRLLRYVPENMRGNLLKRAMSRDAGGLASGRVVSFNRFGLEYNRRIRSAAGGALRAAYLWGGEEFNRLVIDNMDWDVSGVYAFNTAALELLKEARKRGVKTFLEQTIAPFAIESAIVRREQEHFPGWEALPVSVESEDAYISREKKEWIFGDTILCGSAYVRDMIAKVGGDVSKCKVVPYGVKVPVESARQRGRLEGKLRVLFVGTLCLRKGIQYAARAAERLKDKVEMVAVGPSLLTDKGMRIVGESIKCVGSVPRVRMQEYWDWADVLLLPSLCEGSATVTYEAIARGLPVLCTEESGSMVINNKNGLICEAGSADSVIENIKDLLCDSSKLEELSMNALKRRYDVSEAGYRSRLLSMIGGA